MGQLIEIDDARVVDTTMIVSTNRSLTGTDGEGYNAAEDAADVDTFGAMAAAELFASDGDLSRVYVESNVLVITRSAGWDDGATASAQKVIEDFFLFYRDA